VNDAQLLKLIIYYARYKYQIMKTVVFITYLQYTLQNILQHITINNAKTRHFAA